MFSNFYVQEVKMVKIRLWGVSQPTDQMQPLGSGDCRSFAELLLTEDCCPAAPRHFLGTVQRRKAGNCLLLAEFFYAAWGSTAGGGGY